MEEKQTVQKTLPLVNMPTTYRLFIPDNVQRKIREWCYQFPNKEWSGTLFYVVKGTFEDGSLEITCKDFYVSDIGSGTYTEFDHKADIVTYMCEKGLLDCYSGLIHSHNSFSAFFSGTDISTLKEQGMDMPHFLSLIVNNAGQYTARITRRITTVERKVTYPTWNDGHNTESEEVSDTCIESFPLEIDIAEDTALRDEVLQRIKEIEEEKKRNTPQNLTFTGYKSWGQYYEEDELFPSNNPYYRSPVPAVVPVKTEVQKLESKQKNNKPQLVKQGPTHVTVPEEILNRAFIQLVTGSVVSGYSETFNVKQWVEKVMDKAFKRRFPDNDDLFNWIDFYAEYLAWNTFFSDTIDVEDQAQAMASALLKKCAKFKENDVLNVIKLKLEELSKQ